jgi:flagellar L-ring protein precursor FlgH
MNKSRIAAGMLASAFACGVFAGDDAASMLDEQHYRSLVAETKAEHVGDVLTVVVQESASAMSSADLHAQRSYSLSGHYDSPASAPAKTAGVGHDSTSDGTGRTERSGRLLAQISVRVTAVNPNGDLVVSGQQRLQINREVQLITLTGVVRPRDIGENNTVLSSRIGDADIKFDGKGFVERQSRPGWIAWLLSFVGLRISCVRSPGR